MKIIGRKKIEWLILIVIFLCIYMLIIDLTYAGYINLPFLIEKTNQLADILVSLGFIRCNAINLLQGSLGVALTMVTIILNMGNNIFSHSERKVFGLYLGNLTSDNSPLYRAFLNIWIFFPILIIVTINLQLCGISYMLLLSCYLAAFCNYKDLRSSYDERVQRSKVVALLLDYVKDEKNFVNNNLTDFDVAVEDIHKGITEVEGWNNAWRLFQEFTNQIMECDYDKCFMLSQHFFGVVFNVSEGKTVEYELIYIQKYLSTMETEKKAKKPVEKNTKKYEPIMEYIVLWGLLCSVAVKWDRMTMQQFLDWFTEISERSSQRVLMQLGELEYDEIQQQSAMVMVMLECWLYMREEAKNLSYHYIEKIYQYGQHFFVEKNEEFLNRLDYFLTMIEGADVPVYGAAKMLYMDFKLDLDNSLIRSMLKYKLEEE